MHDLQHKHYILVQDMEKQSHTHMCKIILRKRSLVDNNMKTTS